MSSNEFPSPAARPDAEAVETATAVRTAIVRLYGRFRSQRPIGDLGETAIFVLTRLHDGGPASLTELSEMHQVTLASMSNTVNRLTSAGYAVRSKDPADRRRVLLSITAAGDALASEARARRHAWFQARVAELSARDRATLARAAGLLAAIADDPRTEPAAPPHRDDPRPRKGTPHAR